MKKLMKQLWLACVSAVCWVGASVAADIQYVADGGGGGYSGAGYGISVSVSAPASGAVVKYAESKTGPWLDELTYRDVCSAKPIWFQITATGALHVPTRFGYLFDGWWTTADFQRGTKIAEGDGVPSSDTTLHAKWLRRALWYTDAVFHTQVAEVWDGYILGPGDVVAGTIQVKASKPSAKDGTVKASEKKPAESFPVEIK